MVDILSHDNKWLTGAIISHLLDLIVPCSPKHAVFDLLPEGGGGSGGISSNKFDSLVRDSSSIGISTYLSAICKGKHWSLCSAEVSVKTPPTSSSESVLSSPCPPVTPTIRVTARIYDSRGNNKGDTVKTRLEQLLPTESTVTLDLTNHSPLQVDTYSCGVFAIVFAIHIITNHPIPRAPQPALHIWFWRRLLLSLVKGTTLLDSLADSDMRHITEITIPPPQQSIPKPPPPPPPQPTTASSQIDARISLLNHEVLLLRSHIAGTMEASTTRKMDIDAALATLRTALIPVVQSFLSMSTNTISSLTTTISTLDRYIHSLETQILTLKQSTGLVAMPIFETEIKVVEDRLRSLRRTRAALERRLDKARVAMGLFEGLDLSGTVKRLGEVRGECEREVEDGERQLKELEGVGRG